MTKKKVIFTVFYFIFFACTIAFVVLACIYGPRLKDSNISGGPSADAVEPAEPDLPDGSVKPDESAEELTWKGAWVHRDSSDNRQLGQLWLNCEVLVFSDSGFFRAPCNIDASGNVTMFNDCDAFDNGVNYDIIDYNLVSETTSDAVVLLDFAINDGIGGVHWNFTYSDGMLLGEGDGLQQYHFYTRATSLNYVDYVA